MNKPFALCLVGGFIAAPAGAQSPLDELKSGVSAAFDEINSRGPSYQNNTRETCSDTAQPGPPVSVYTELSKRRTRPNGCYLSESSPAADTASQGDRTPRGVVWGSNSKYRFRLSSSKGGGWTLAEAALAGAQPAAETRGASRMLAVANDPLTWHYRSAVTVPLTKLLSHRKFVCTSLSKPGPTGTLFRVEFDITANDLLDGAPGDLRIVGKYDIDRAKSWSIVERHETIHHNGMACATSSQFSTVAIDGIHFLTSESRSSRVEQDGKVLQSLKIDFEHEPSLSGGVPESEFTLSAYGLPEPVGVTWVKPTPRYVWWLLALGGCALVALVCRLAVRRMRRPAA